MSFWILKAWKGREKLQYLENEKNFHSFWRAVIWWKKKKNSGHKLYSGPSIHETIYDTYLYCFTICLVFFFHIYYAFMFLCNLSFILLLFVFLDGQILTFWCTKWLADWLMHPFTNSFTLLLAQSLTYSLTHLFTCFLTCLLTYLVLFLINYLLTYLQF